MDLSPLIEHCKENGIELSLKQTEQFEKYGERLYELNKSMNLTRVPYEECALRHFVDSLLVSEFVPEGTSVLDVGSGPGFPSWPIACANPNLEVTALDSSGKMLKILREVTLPNLAVCEGRAEDMGFREQFDVITGRAVAPLPIQLEVSAAWARIGGIVVPFRTPSEEDEIRSFRAEALGLELESVEKCELANTDIVRVFPIFRKVHLTRQKYPRSWGKIKKDPL